MPHRNWPLNFPNISWNIIYYIYNTSTHIRTHIRTHTHSHSHTPRMLNQFANMHKWRRKNTEPHTQTRKSFQSSSHIIIILGINCIPYLCMCVCECALMKVAFVSGVFSCSLFWFYVSLFIRFVLHKPHFLFSPLLIFSLSLSLIGV